MDLKTFSSWLMAFVGLIGLLWGANLSRERRYVQNWLPGAAAIFAAAGVYWYDDFWEPLVTMLVTFLQQLGITWLPPTKDFPLVFNYLVLLLFLLLKSLGLGLFSLLRRIQRVASRGRQDAGAAAPGSEPPLPRWSWAYEWHLERGVLLRQEWVYPGMVLRFLPGLLFLLLAVCLFQLVRPLPLQLPQFPALSLLLVLELA